MTTSKLHMTYYSHLLPKMIAILSLFLVAVGVYLCYQWFLPKPLPGIAYNPEATRSLFGDAPSMSRELHATGEFSKWLAKQIENVRSPICQVFVRPFSLPWILVGDYQECQDILMRRPEFDKAGYLIDGLQGLGDFHARYKTNGDFRARRHLRQDLMAPSFLHNTMGPFMHSEGIKLIKLLEIQTNLANGRPFSILSDYWHTALDVMTYYAFGGNMNDPALDPQLELISKIRPSEIPEGHVDEPVTFPEAPLSEFLLAVQDAPRVLEKTAVSWVPKLSFWWWKRQAWVKTIFFHKDRVLPQQLRKAFEVYKAGKVQSALEHIIMREGMAAEKEGRQPQFITQSIADEIFTDVISGHHTTGGVMAWMTKYLTDYPYVQSKLRDALYSAIPEAVREKRLPTFEELRHARIPYLEAVIEETNRLTPFTIVREAARDTEILGRRVPKGCQVFMVNAGPGFLSPSIPVDDVLRSPTSKAAKSRGKWDETKDLKTFEPERWLIHNEDGGVEFNSTAGPHLNFGAGIRQCWGRKMAHLEIRTVMALVIWNFELQEIPEQLGGYAGYDGIAREPQKAFVRLRKLSP
ncbi:cytochrome P450 [Annulohypoxylon truncatum]|uniref:cytochrome P450 n=1 Tax=Annulohypoxylon truncatum TaxID=327061 RepID=UPI002008B436|nr:cytochrome P450 [Annulohypoxylon truncatum]KAI1209138.1 cytochrome P450 [Annulohypoxylon truncatum]